MKYKLICMDIDGTLLNDNKELLPQVKQSLLDVTKKGVHIALASGRMPAGVDNIEKELGIQCIKICNAGTYTILDNECIAAEYLSLSVMENIYKEFAEKNNIPLWIFKEQEWFVTGVDKYVEREISIIHHQPQIVKMEDIIKKWTDEKIYPNKLLIASNPEMIQKIYKQIKQKMDIDIACSSPTFIEIFSKGVSKGTALQNVCNKLNIDIKDSIAFGDQELDISMIEAAGVGIAMGNAIQELKEKADFITKTNNEAGIAYALEYYFKE